MRKGDESEKKHIGVRKKKKALINKQARTKGKGPELYREGPSYITKIKKGSRLVNREWVLVNRW